ncbi:EAL domain-containing protein [Kineosporia succinea]|uniref:Diguanylate cyclase (GGDEF)-like protein n=1 Tax=Kineosporia succinea TaxID=84632 RepID=A0ABT9P737_9ACTN|nr:EAL domain-containing protein [Kineosporia succinea]MDP9828521.1 diguanylate cyclase (GGDEF)-like protein [Kineosporia succinea]
MGSSPGLSASGNLALATAALAGLTLVPFTGLVDASTTRTLADVNLVLAGSLATASLAHSWRRSGGNNLWRPLLATGTALWTLAQLLDCVGRILGGPGAPLTALVGAGRLALPLLALAAVLRLPTRAPREPEADDGSRPARPYALIALALDTVIVTGSLLLLTWVTSLEPMVDAPGHRPLALAAPPAYLALVSTVVLTTRFRRAADPRACALLGAGLVTLAVAGTHLARLPDAPGRLVPLGLVAGFLLLATAALSTGPGPHTGHLRKLARVTVHVPAALAALVLTVHVLTGPTPDAVETGTGLGLAAALVARRLVAGLDNVRLVRELRESHDRLRAQAFSDSLTGLANRARFDQRLRAAIRGGRPLGLLFCDLDDFKAVNDRLGHNAGDDLLRAVGIRLRACVRPGDTVARLGGDEFAILMEDADEGPDVIGRRILAALGRPFQIGHRGRETRVRVGASVGVAVLDRVAPDASPESLLAGVDQAMYAAKRRGKNQLVTFRTGSGNDRPDRYLPLLDPAAPPAERAGPAAPADALDPADPADPAVPAVPAAQAKGPATGSIPPPGLPLPQVMDQTGPIPRVGPRTAPGGLTTPAARYRGSGQAKPEPPKPEPSPEAAREAEKDKLVAATQRDTERWLAEYQEAERRSAERDAAERRALEWLQIEAEVRAGTRPEAEIIPIGRAVDIIGEKARRAAEKAEKAERAEKAHKAEWIEKDEKALAETLEHTEQLSTLSSDHIDLVYHPVLGLNSGRLEALTASARWRHPVHGVMDADSLMSAAEHAGLRRPLEERLFDSIGGDIARLRRAPAWEDLVAHVPLSASHLTDERLPTVLERTLRRHDLPGRALLLLITETYPLPDLGVTAGILERIRDLGTGIGLDAFGTGPVGLEFLTRLPVTSVTLHGSLTVAEPHTRAFRVLAGTAAMVNDLDLMLVADDVNDQEQADRLAGLGIDQAQGPLYGKPVPLPDLDLITLPMNPARR